MAKQPYDQSLSRHVWEGWRVRDFIDVLEPSVQLIMSGGSWHRPFRTKAELEKWCADSQPYVKVAVPEVVDYFASRYGIG